jgi:hypothetical protein
MPFCLSFSTDTCLILFEVGLVRMNLHASLCLSNLRVDVNNLRFGTYVLLRFILK